MTRVEYHAVDAENDILRDKLKAVRAAAATLCDTVEQYARQGVSRSILMNTVASTREILRGGGED